MDSNGNVGIYSNFKLVFFIWDFKYLLKIGILILCCYLMLSCLVIFGITQKEGNVSK